MTKFSKFDYLIDGNWVLTSLCPTLGQMNPQQHKGVCPLHFQEPFGKTLNISFVGIAPFITYNPVRGSEFMVMKILAKKYQFIPKFIPARSWDNVHRGNKTIIYGMVHWVSLTKITEF